MGRFFKIPVALKILGWVAEMAMRHVNISSGVDDDQ